MENRNEKNGWMSVPQFGGWDQKSQKADYSMVFQRARVNRKQNKANLKQMNMRNEEEPISLEAEQSPPKRKNILSYINCCIKA